MAVVPGGSFLCDTPPWTGSPLAVSFSQEDGHAILVKHQSSTGLGNWLAVTRQTYDYGISHRLDNDIGVLYRLINHGGCQDNPLPNWIV